MSYEIPEHMHQQVWQLLLIDTETAVMRGRPSFILRPRLFIDGDQWCALLGENLQVGIAGFGDSPDAAYLAFDDAWFRTLAPAQPATEPGRPEFGACGIADCRAFSRRVDHGLCRDCAEYAARRQPVQP